MIKLQEKNGEVDLSRKKWKGDPGGYYKPAVDAEGTLTWAPSDEDMEPVGEANILGPKGDKGEPGADGKNTVWLGSEEPGEDYNVWVNPNGEASAGLVTHAELEKELEDYAKATDIPSLDGYAKTTDIPDVSGFALKTEIPDVSGFTTMTAVEAKGYQTADQVQSAINTALGVIENGSY